MKTALARCLVHLLVSLGAFVHAHGQNGTAPQAVGSQACGACFVLDESGGVTVIPLESTEVVLDVKPGLLEAEVSQTFTNHGATPLEAIYRYPLPPGATITHFELRYPDHTLVSVVREKQAARTEYETAKTEGRRAALLEQFDPSLFSTSVANFLPGETVRAVLRFIQPIELRADVLEVRFPMVTGTKYFPAQGSPTAAAQAAAQPDHAGAGLLGAGHVYAFDVSVAGMGARRIESPSHRISVESEGDDVHFVALAEEITVPDRDFVLRVERDAAKTLEPTWVTQRTASGDYGMLTVYPPATAAPGSPAAARPRDVLFLVDRSGSMQGVRFESAKTGLDRCLQRLRPQDRFHVVAFSTGYMFYADTWRRADAAAVGQAREWVRALKVDGGTELQAALAACLDAFEEVDRDQILIVLTDGDVGDEKTLVTLVERKLRRARVFPLGIGDAPNPYLIAKLAQCGRGQARFISDDRQIARELDGLFATIDAPVLTEVSVRFLDDAGGMVVCQRFPDTLPDVFLGCPVQTVVRIPAGRPGTAVIEGVLNGRRHQQSFTLVGSPVRGDGLERLFGSRLAADLDDMMRREPDEAARELIRQELVATALQFGLVTEFTSRVAIDRAHVVAPEGSTLTTVNIAQSAVANQGATFDPNDPNTVVLSPFQVSANDDGYHTAATAVAGTRLSTNVRDVGAAIHVINAQFLRDTGATAMEDLLPFAMEAQDAPSVASGLDRALTDGLPVVAIPTPTTVSDVVEKSFGLAAGEVRQRRAGIVPVSTLTAVVGDDGYAAATVEIGGALDDADRLPILAIASWERDDTDRWTLWMDTEFVDDRRQVRGTVHGRDLGGYGRLTSLRAGWRERLGDDLRLEIVGLTGRLERDDATQFHLDAPGARYDGLGFFNLDLLTADLRSIDEQIARGTLDGAIDGGSWSHRWGIAAQWHRRETDWRVEVDGATAAPRTETTRLEVADRIGLFDDGLILTPAWGLARWSTPGQSQPERSATRSSFDVALHLSDAFSLVGVVADDSMLPEVQTGHFLQTGQGLVSASAGLERHRGGQLGIHLALRDNRLTGRFAWFRESIDGLRYRAWGWERDHAATGPVWIDASTVRQPVSTAEWPQFTREGWIGTADFNPTREFAATACWAIDTADEGPYRGGNRRASVFLRYRPVAGWFARWEIGGGAAWRNDLTFDDGHRLEGGARLDLFLARTFRFHAGRQTRVQINCIDLADTGVQPTRFVENRGRRVHVSVSQSF